MQGETGCQPTENPPINNALEYRFLSDSLSPLMHPVGEDIGEGLLCKAKNDCGNLVPYFCDEYVKNTGKNVVAVHTARFSTKIEHWLKGCERFDCMVEKIKSAIKKTEDNFEIDKIYLIWLQGETDATKGTSKSDYLERLTDFKNSLKQEFRLDKFCIIQVGYYCSIASWIKYANTQEGIDRDHAIMDAQKTAESVDSDFVLLTEICKTLSKDKEYLNPRAEGHYNNTGQALIGKTAGKQLALLDKGGKNNE